MKKNIINTIKPTPVDHLSSNRKVSNNIFVSGDIKYSPIYSRIINMQTLEKKIDESQDVVKQTQGRNKANLKKELI